MTSPSKFNIIIRLPKGITFPSGKKYMPVETESQWKYLHSLLDVMNDTQLREFTKELRRVGRLLDQINEENK